MSNGSDNGRGIAQAAALLVGLTIVFFAAAKAPPGNPQLLAQSFAIAFGAAAVYLIQRFDAAAGQKTPDLQGRQTQATTVDSPSPALSRLVAISACAAACTIVLMIIQIGTDETLSVIQSLEASKALTVTDEAWNRIAITSFGTWTLLFYFPIVAYLAIRFTKLTGNRLGFGSFAVVSLAAFLIRVFQNYGADLISAAPASNFLGPKLTHAVQAGPGQLVLVIAQIGALLAMVIAQSTYMTLCSWIATRRMRLVG